MTIISMLSHFLLIVRQVTDLKGILAQRFQPLLLLQFLSFLSDLRNRSMNFGGFFIYLKKIFLRKMDDETEVFEGCKKSIRPIMSKSDNICLFFLRGKCKWGRKCRNLHKIPQVDQSDQIWNFFQR